MIQLIVLDYIGTLASGLPETYFYRSGVSDFLKRNNLPATVFTDLSREEAERGLREDLKKLGVTPYLREPFFFKESLDQDRHKNLGLVAQHFGVHLNDTVMIGDHKQDFDSARKYGTRIIIVPRLGVTIGSKPCTALDFRELGDLQKEFALDQVREINFYREWGSETIHKSSGDYTGDYIGG